MLLHELLLGEIEKNRIDRDRDAAGSFLLRLLAEGVATWPDKHEWQAPAPAPRLVYIPLPKVLFADDAEWQRWTRYCKAFRWLVANKDKQASFPEWVQTALAETISRMRPWVNPQLMLVPIRKDGTPARETASGRWDDLDVFWQSAFASLLAPHAFSQRGACARCGKALETTPGGRASKRSFCKKCAKAIWIEQNREHNRRYQAKYQRKLRKEKAKKK